MSSFKIGSSTVKDITIGSTKINKIYIGSSMLWQRGGIPDDLTGLVLNSSGNTVIGYALRLPDTVTTLDYYALMCGAGLKYLFLPSSLSSIEGQVLPGSGIKQLYIPDACNLGFTNFNICHSVATVRFPTTGYIDWSDQFVECTGVQWLVFPNRSLSFSSRTFSGCTNLKKIYFEGPPPSSYSGSFSGCTFAVYTKDSGWTSSVKSSFASGCGGTVTSWNTFTTAPTVSPTAGFTLSSGRYSNGTDIIVPNTITLDSSASNSTWTSYQSYFGNNHISAINIPSGVTTLGEQCFTNCSQLASLTIPSAITSIKDKAFWECVALKKLYFEGNPPTISSTALKGRSLTIYTKSGNTKWTSSIKTSTYGGATSVTWATY